MLTTCSLLELEERCFNALVWLSGIRRLFPNDISMVVVVFGGQGNTVNGNLVSVGNSFTEAKSAIPPRQTTLSYLRATTWIVWASIPWCRESLDLFPCLGATRRSFVFVKLFVAEARVTIYFRLLNQQQSIADKLGSNHCLITVHEHYDKLLLLVLLPSSHIACGLRPLSY